MALPPLLDRNRGWGLAAVAVLMVVQAGGAGAAAFATRALFEAMHSGRPLPVTALAVLVGAGLMIAATRVAARQIGERIGQDYARQIRTALFESAARMPARAVAQRRNAYMSLRFVGDMTAFRTWLGLGLPTLVAAFVSVPAMFAVLWLIDPVFVWAVLPIVVPVLALIAWGGLRLVPLQTRLRTRRARIAAEMAERMPMAPQLDRLGRRSKEICLLEKRTDAMITTALQLRLGVESLKALSDLATGVAVPLVIVVGYRSGLGTGNIAAALAVVGLLLSPLRDLGAVWNYRAAFRAAAIKAEAALSRAHRDVYRDGKSLPSGAVEVVFDDVALPSGARLTLTVARGASTDLVLPEHDAVAVVNMLLGLDAPSNGTIQLSGIDLRDLSRGTLRRNVQRVGTKPEILQGSLRRVLMMGCDDRLDDAAIELLAREAGLSHFLDRIGGLDGRVLEGGKNLTHAEKLAISLFRIRLSKPKLILIDLHFDARLDDTTAYDVLTFRPTVIRLKAHEFGAQSAA